MNEYELYKKQREKTRLNDAELHQVWRETTVLDPDEVAVITKKPLKSVYAAMKRGTIPFITIGRSKKTPTHLLIKMIDGE